MDKGEVKVQHLVDDQCSFYIYILKKSICFVLFHIYIFLSSTWINSREMFYCRCRVNDLGAIFESCIRLLCRYVMLELSQMEACDPVHESRCVSVTFSIEAVLE